MSNRKDLAAALLEEHAVRPEALARLRREQGRSGQPLFAVLLDSGLCTEDAIFLALRRWSGAPVLSEERLAGLLVPPDLREAVPKELALSEGVLPLERSADGRRVALAMVDPLSEVAQVRAALGRRGVIEIHRFLLHRAVLHRTVGRLYGDPAPGDLPLTEQPTGIVRLPEGPRGRSVARAERGQTPRSPRASGPHPLLSPPLARSLAATQQTALSAEDPGRSVQIDPDLMAEIHRFESGQRQRSDEQTGPMPMPLSLDGAARAFADALGLLLSERPQALSELALHSAATLFTALRGRLGPSPTDAIIAALSARTADGGPAADEITPILSPDTDPTREVTLPGPSPDPGSDPELEIEVGEVSDAGLLAYDYEEK